MRERTIRVAGAWALALWGASAGTALAQEKAQAQAKPADPPKLTAGAGLYPVDGLPHHRQCLPK